MLIILLVAIHSVILDLPVVIGSNITRVPWSVAGIREIMQGHNYVILRVRKIDGEELEMIVLKKFQSILSHTVYFRCSQYLILLCLKIVTANDHNVDNHYGMLH